MDVQQELAGLRSSLASVAEQVEAFEAEVGGVDPGFSGPTPAAAENRTIRTARARLAQQQAREMREGLDRLRAQAATMATEARSVQARVQRGEPRRTAASAPAALVAPVAPVAASASGLHDLALELARAETRDDVLIRLVAGALRVVPGTRWAGVCSLRHDGSLRPEAVSAPVVRELLTLHDTLRGGPCSDVLDTGTPGPVVVPDLAHDLRWVRLGERAGTLGFRCLLVHRIEGPGGRRPLALLVGGGEPGALGESAEQTVQVLADHALIALAGVRRSDGLSHAATSRDVVGHAQGILMARHGLDPQEALDRLLLAAEQANTRMVDVATWVVDNTLGAGRAGSDAGPT